MTDESFLTTAELTVYLQLNLRTVYRLIKAGKIPAVRVGRQWRFRQRDVDLWLDSPQPASASSKPQSKMPAGHLTRPRVVVVDPSEVTLELLSKTLTLADYEVEVLADSRSALERLSARPCDLLITELRMPKVDGFFVIREAKRYSPDVKVIIVTGFSTESSAIEAANLGVVAYFKKPIRGSQVLVAAARALAQ